MRPIESLTSFFAALDQLRGYYQDVDGNGSRNGRPPVDWYRDSLHLWFRGHSKGCVDLLPAVMRGPFISRAGEVEPNVGNPHVHLAASMFRQFEHRAHGRLERGASEAVNYFVAQHHGLPTCLLDWSGSPLVALYFAVAYEDHERSRGEVVVVRAEPHASEAGRYGILAEHDPEVARRIADLLSPEMVRLPESGFPLFVAPRPRDARMERQHARFTLHWSHQNIAQRPNPDFLWRIPVLAKAKAVIRRELRTLGIHQGALFPDLANIADQIKREAGLYFRRQPQMVGKSAE